MKVKVKVKHAPLNQVEYFLNEALSEALADLNSAHRETEKLFQENKDLRVGMSHAQDEIKMLRHQIEAYEQEADNWTEDHRVMLELREEQAKYTDKLKSKLATACAERDNWEASFKQMTKWWENATDAKTEVEQELHSTQIELADRNERIFILEQRIEMLEQQNQEWEQTTNSLATKVVEQTNEINHATEEAYDLDRKNLDLEMTITELQNEVDKLTAELRTITVENSTLLVNMSNLEDELDAAITIKNDYAEQIGDLRTKCATLEKKANDTTGSFWNFLVEHGLVKTEEELKLGGNINEA